MQLMFVSVYEVNMIHVLNVFYGPCDYTCIFPIFKGAMSRHYQSYDADQPQHLSYIFYYYLVSILFIELQLTSYKRVALDKHFD